MQLGGSLAPAHPSSQPQTTVNSAYCDWLVRVKGVGRCTLRLSLVPPSPVRWQAQQSRIGRPIQGFPWMTVLDPSLFDVSGQPAGLDVSAERED